MITYFWFFRSLFTRVVCPSTSAIITTGGYAKRRRIFFLVWLIVFGSGLPLHAASLSEEVHRYQEVTGETVTTLQWHLKNENGATLRCASPREHHTTIVGPDYDTSHWQVLADDGQTDFVAMRQGNTIQINGRFKGQAINKTLHIDGAPWYQATSLSLRKLAASDDSHQVFWTIRYPTLTVHKVKAAKNGLESVASIDGPKALMHIRLSLTGLLSPFWKSDYWFSLPEFVFYRFRGPSGPPGSPMTVITRMDG